MPTRFTPIGCVLFALIIPVFSRAQENFDMRVLTNNLNYPWEITMGPDNFIWVTERVGKRVRRVDPSTGDKQTLITINEVYQSAGQDGLMGMALHPKLLNDSPYVYVAYTYDADAGGGVNRKTKIVQLTYNQNPSSPALSSPITLIDNIPASYDHNSGRLKIGPDSKLYYTIGDMGNNQFDNKCQTIYAQSLPTQTDVNTSNRFSYQGKILRLNFDGSIPSDNPEINAVRSHIYSYGHRNAQGIVFTPNNKLFASEHGPRSDDELNEILPGSNYGWPRVAGYNDNQNYQYVIWSSSGSCASTPYGESTVPAGATVQAESTFSSAFETPVFTFFTKPAGFSFPSDYIQWPTIAPSSIDVYTRGLGGVINWEHSILVPSLKKGRIYRLKMNSDYSAISGDTTSFAYTQNRYRDIALSSNQLKIYVATDNGGNTSGPSGSTVSSVNNPGAILEFEYVGIVTPIRENGDVDPDRVNVSVNIYPVPTTGAVTVNIGTSLRRPFHYELVDVAGRVLLKNVSSRNSFDINLQPFPAGMYFLRITTATGELLPLKKIMRQ